MLRRFAAAMMTLALAAAPLAVAAQGYGPHGHSEGDHGGHGWGGGGWGAGGYSRGGEFRGLPRSDGGYGGRGGPRGGPGGDFEGRSIRNFDSGPRGERDYPGDRRDRGGYGRGAVMSERVFGGQIGRGGGRWMRGQFLPPDARGAVVQDFGRFHLRRPPRGYYWYRAGDDYVMASTANGMIFEVIPADPY